MVSSTSRGYDILNRFPNAIHIQSGGQKAVYKDYHEFHGEVVLKVCEVASSDEFSRIAREVDLLRDIVSIYYPRHFSFEQLDDRHFLIIEEYLSGKALTQMLSEFSCPKIAIKLMSQLVEALKVLWNRGVVHRDLKPANIIISPLGEPRIIDLGIARLLDGTSLTLSRAFMGPCTPFFASPEQLKNYKADIDFRSDQFSLGILLFMMLTKGNHPFDPVHVGRGSSIVDNILAGQSAIDTIEGDRMSNIKALINRLLAPEPYLRFRTFQLLQTEIQNCSFSHQ